MKYVDFFANAAMCAFFFSMTVFLLALVLVPIGLAIAAIFI